jgi:cytochrome c oxidase subunit III
MDLTQGTLEEKNIRAKKMMLWFAIGSIIMLFGGLTSAYIVSKTRPDWLKDFQLPSAFFISTAIMLCSSLTFHLAKITIKKGNHHKGMLALAATFFLGIAFVFFQFKGFSQIIKNGYYFTGSESSITTSFLYVIVFTHVVHIFAGLIALLAALYNHYKKKYADDKTLGLEMAATFWHFLDFLWLYLILFFYFFK